MVEKQIIDPGWPAYEAYPEFKPGIRIGDVLYISGCGGADPRDGSLPVGMKAQARKALDNMKEVVEAAGGSMDNVVETIIFITDMASAGEVYEVNPEYFSARSPITGTLVEIKSLALEGMLIEIHGRAILD